MNWCGFIKVERKMKKSIDLDIYVVQVALFLSWMFTFVMSLIVDDGDTYHILSAIYLVGWVLYDPKKEKILKTFSFKIGRKSC